MEKSKRAWVLETTSESARQSMAANTGGHGIAIPKTSGVMAVVGNSESFGLEEIPLTELTHPPAEHEDLSGLSKGRKWSLFACSCLLQFLLQLDMASVAVTLPVCDVITY